MSPLIIIFLVGIAFLVYMIFTYVYKLIKLREEQIEGLARGTLEMTPRDFLKMRYTNFGALGSLISANHHGFSGVYTIFNHSKNIFYVGQSQNVLDGIYSQFVGRGNKYMYTDYRNGDVFTIKAAALGYSEFSTLGELKRYTNSSFSSHWVNYSRVGSKKSQTPTRMPTITPSFKRGLSVTQRIKEVKQPYGGYIPRKVFDETFYDDGITLGEENTSPILIGLAVDYLTRFSMGTPPRKAFEISFIGAQLVKEEELATHLLGQIDGLSDTAIISACKLSGFDVVIRAGPPAYTKPVSEINPDETTIENVRTMVNRSLAFFEKNGPITKDGFTLQGGYTDTISSGDGDFLTADTLWDFKVSKNLITSKHTLQLLIYYLMGRRSIHEEFQQIEYLGVFNPRQNKVYRYKIADLDKDIIRIVEKDVIGY